MHILQNFHINRIAAVLVFLFIIRMQGFTYHYDKKMKCLNPPRTARKVQNHMKGCQEEIKNRLFQEAYEMWKNDINANNNISFKQQIIKDAAKDSSELSFIKPIDLFLSEKSAAKEEKVTDQLKESFREISTINQHTRMARLLANVNRVNDLGNSDVYQSSMRLPLEDKRIAGCLLHCVYNRNNAIDRALGWPTLNGLVNFYAEGINEHGVFMAILHAVNFCLHSISQKYHKNDYKTRKTNGETCEISFDTFDCISDRITTYCLHHYKA